MSVKTPRRRFIEAIHALMSTAGTVDGYRIKGNGVCVVMLDGTVHDFVSLDEALTWAAPRVELAVLRSLVRRAVPMLHRLGDFVGNGELDPARTDSLGMRCDLLLDISRALNGELPGADPECSQCRPGHDRGDGRCSRHGKRIEVK